MSHRITLICGDGIGQEVMPATERVLSVMDVSLELDYASAGFGTFEAVGDALPESTLAQCAASDAVLFGATQSPMTKVAGYQSPILSLRRHFDLYANLRPAKQGAIDMLIVRENTEGLYSRREQVNEAGDRAMAERVITARASERIVRVACEQAMARQRRLTIVHKANVLKETCGLFRECAFAVTADFPALTVDEMLVDACAMRLAMDATQFDVIVTTNLFGDILSDLAAGVTGGLGCAPSANIGMGVPVFEPVHGSAPDIVGQGIADPRATFLSAALMLAHLGYDKAAEQLTAACHQIEHTGNTQQTTNQIMEVLHSWNASP